jgi:outer membrane protein, heavy metal efflux system
MRRRGLSGGLVFFFCLCAAPISSAQVRLSLNDALTAAWQANPQLAAVQGQLDEAKAQRLQAGLGPNPRLVVQAEDYRFWGSPPHSFPNTTEDYGYIGQILETDGKRRKRVEVASSLVRQSALEQDLMKKRLRARVAAAYWNAAGAARIRDLLQENLRTYDEDVIYDRNRVQQGVMAETDLMRLELERDRVRMQHTVAANDADQAVIELYRAIGRSDYPATVLTDSLDTIPHVALPDMPQILETRPELRIGREMITEAESNIKLQKANAKPDPEVYFGYKRDIQQNTLYGAVQVDLPIRNRNQGAIASSEAQLRINQAHLANAEVNVKADVAGAERAYRNALDVAQGFSATRRKRLSAWGVPLTGKAASI